MREEQDVGRSALSKQKDKKKRADMPRIFHKSKKKTVEKLVSLDSQLDISNIKSKSLLQKEDSYKFEPEQYATLLSARGKTKQEQPPAEVSSEELFALWRQQPAKRKLNPQIIITAFVLFIILLTLFSILILSQNSSINIQGNETKFELKNPPAITIKNRPAANDHYLTTEGALSLPELMQKTAPSIVGVMKYNKSIPLSDSERGSGIVLSSDGYILTAARLVEKSDGIKVMLNNGKEYTGYLLGSDSISGLAVIKINSTNLIAAEFGDATLLHTGEDIIAVASTSESNDHVFISRGVVSSLDHARQLSSGITLSCIQTDAKIAGQSIGGALVNVQGQIVGMVSDNLSNSDDPFGYAISIGQVKGIISDLTTFGFVQDRVKLGISVQPVDNVMIMVYGIEKGLYIKSVDYNSDAYLAGLRVGDIITDIDGIAVDTVPSFTEILLKHKPGDKVNLTISRNNKYGESTTVYIKVGLSAAGLTGN